MPSTHLGPGVFVLVSVYPGRVNTTWWERLLPSSRAEELKKKSDMVLWCGLPTPFCTELQIMDSDSVVKTLV